MTALPLDLVNETVRPLDLLFRPWTKDVVPSSPKIYKYTRDLWTFRVLQWPSWGTWGLLVAGQCQDPITRLQGTLCCRAMLRPYSRCPYPNWADRLYRLWKEADNPSKKSPRFTYWIVVSALCFAIFLGLVATSLGTTQVWIPYCAWKDDSGVIGCGNIFRSLLRILFSVKPIDVFCQSFAPVFPLPLCLLKGPALTLTTNTMI